MSEPKAAASARQAGEGASGRRPESEGGRVNIAPDLHLHLALASCTLLHIAGYLLAHSLLTGDCGRAVGQGCSLLLPLIPGFMYPLQRQRAVQSTCSLYCPRGRCPWVPASQLRVGDSGLVPSEAATLPLECTGNNRNVRICFFLALSNLKQKTPL